MKKFLSKLYILSALLLPTRAFAAAPPKLDEIGGIFESVFELILPVGGLFALGMVVYGGYMWMLSSGDPGKLKQAQGTLTWAIIGLVFLAVFRTVLKSIFDFIGN